MTVTVLKALLKEKKLRAIHDVLSMYNPVDLAELLSELDDAELATVFRILDKPKAAETFTYMDQDLRQELIKTFSSTEIANLFEELFADDAADFLGDMPANFVTQLLEKLLAGDWDEEFLVCPPGKTVAACGDERKLTAQ